MKYAKTPWVQASRADIYGHVKPGSPVKIFCGGDACIARVLVNDGQDDEAEANAARIVACVNACEGINPEAVPEMLRALRHMREAVRAHLRGDMMAKITHADLGVLDDALSKAEGR